RPVPTGCGCSRYIWGICSNRLRSRLLQNRVKDRTQHDLKTLELVEGLQAYAQDQASLQETLAISFRRIFRALLEEGIQELRDKLASMVPGVEESNSDDNNNNNNEEDRDTENGVHEQRGKEEGEEH
ncbi:hypothetical protein DXG01_002600, partial [Tephrocybe rancida]